MKTSYEYSPKEIFAKKLNGTPFDVRRDDLPQQLDKWLVKREIMIPHNEKYGTRFTYICKYPIRIWHTNNNGMNFNHLLPGDIWTF